MTEEQKAKEALKKQTKQAKPRYSDLELDVLFHMLKHVSRLQTRAQKERVMNYIFSRM